MSIKVRGFPDFFVVGPYIHLDIMYNHEKSIYWRNARKSTEQGWRAIRWSGNYEQHRVNNSGESIEDQVLDIKENLHAIRELYEAETV